jgi:hypothetical protein
MAPSQRDRYSSITGRRAAFHSASKESAVSSTRPSTSGSTQSLLSGKSIRQSSGMGVALPEPEMNHQP